MLLSNKDIEKIAHLARLQIDPKDIPAYCKDLSNILDLFSKMEQVNTDDVVPIAHPHPRQNSQRIRADEVTEHVLDEMPDFQKIAPATEADLYLVPEVIQQEQ